MKTWYIISLIPVTATDNPVIGLSRTLSSFSRPISHYPPPPWILLILRHVFVPLFANIIIHRLSLFSTAERYLEVGPEKMTLNIKKA